MPDSAKGVQNVSALKQNSEIGRMCYIYWAIMEDSSDGESERPTSILVNVTEMRRQVEEQRRRRKAETAKRAKARHKQTKRFKETSLAYSRLPKVKQWRSDYQKSDHGRAAHKKHRATEKFKVGARRRAKEPAAAIMNRLRQMLTKNSYNSETIRFATEFGTNAEWKAHMQSTFAPWMNWENRGKYTRGDPYRSKWNIGHRIPCALYDFGDPVDVKRCFSKANLYAQCARENIELGQKHVPTGVERERLRPVWPKCWCV